MRASRLPAGPTRTDRYTRASGPPQGPFHVPRGLAFRSCSDPATCGWRASAMLPVDNVATCSARLVPARGRRHADVTSFLIVCCENLGPSGPPGRPWYGWCSSGSPRLIGGVVPGGWSTGCPTGPGAPPDRVPHRTGWPTGPGGPPDRVAHLFRAGWPTSSEVGDTNWGDMAGWPTSSEVGDTDCATGHELCNDSRPVRPKLRATRPHRFTAGRAPGLV